jgi:hypothetical protein
MHSPVYQGNQVTTRDRSFDIVNLIKGVLDENTSVGGLREIFQFISDEYRP